MIRVLTFDWDDLWEFRGNVLQEELRSWKWPTVADDKSTPLDVILNPNVHGDFVVPAVRTGISSNSNRRGVRMSLVVLRGVDKRFPVEFVQSDLDDPDAVEIWFASSFELRTIRNKSRRNRVGEFVKPGEVVLLVEAPKLVCHRDRHKCSFVTIRLRSTTRRPFLLTLALRPDWRKEQPLYFLDANDFDTTDRSILDSTNDPLHFEPESQDHPFQNDQPVSLFLTDVFEPFQ